MLRNYLVTALRSLRRNVGHTAINVLGLAVGLASCLLIGRYVADAWRYDRSHEHADRIVRVSSKITPSNGERLHIASAPAPLTPALEAEVPQVEAVVRLIGGSYLLKRGATQMQVEELFYADPSFFNVFSFDLLKGDPATALEAPQTIVLTESLAARYFGTEDPMGKTLMADDDKAFTVTGVVDDPPPTSHIKFSGLVSMATQRDLHPSRLENWATVRFWTYVLLTPGAAPEVFATQLEGIVERYAAARYAAYNATIDFEVTPLLDVYLYGEGIDPIGPHGNPTVLSIFAIVAIFILLIAGVNFVNLATARSMERAREVGVRKALGAPRTALVSQFLIEAVLIALLALGLAVGLARVILPLFHALTGTTLAGGLIPNAVVVLGLVSASVGLGLLAGVYPALVLAGYQPVRVLRGAFGTSREGQTLRQGLVVVQFAIAIALIASTGIVRQQLRYIQSRDLGFAAEQLVALDFNQDFEVNRQMESIKREMMQLPGVEAVATSRRVPGREQVAVTPLAVEHANGRVQRTSAYHYDVGFNFFATYDIGIVAGRAFSADFASDSTQAIVVNAAAATHFGYPDPDDAVGKRVALDVGEDAPRYTIVGVVEDFHYVSLHEAVEPLVLLPHSAQNADFARFLTLRVRTERLAETMSAVKARWSTLVPHRPFVARFLDQNVAALYEQDRRFGRLFAAFAGLAIFVACLGLFGLAAYTVQQRTKEIGIRKALGASAASLVALLSSDFAKLVGMAFAVAVPIAYLGMTRWLEGFAYRIDLGVGVFVAAGVLALVVALGTVGVQAWRAARLDPTTALRSE